MSDRGTKRSTWNGADRSRPVRHLPGRNRSKADVFAYDVDGAIVAVKDYRPRSWWIRNTLGRWLIAREIAAYRALEGVAGLPAFAGRVDAFAFALEWIEAIPVSELDATGVDDAWLSAVEATLDAMHRRGVAHGDLHHRDVLIRPDGTPILVDLATSWIVTDSASAWRKAVFHRLREADQIALARMRARAAGRDPDGAVRALGGSAARWHRRGRRIKRWINRVRGR